MLPMLVLLLLMMPITLPVAVKDLTPTIPELSCRSVIACWFCRVDPCYCCCTSSVEL